jgi:hypothetical protein
MKCFHIAIAVRDLDASSRPQLTAWLPTEHDRVGRIRYVAHRLLNFSINEMPERAGQLRHVASRMRDKE